MAGYGHKLDGALCPGKGDWEKTTNIYFSQKYFGHHFSQIFEEQIHPKKSILLILFLRTNLVEILEGYKWLGPFLHDLMHFMINGYFQNLGHGTSLRECQV